MKVLSIAFVGHDHNAAFFDNGSVKYIKHERFKQVKRFAYDNLDEMVSETCVLFGIKKQDCDAIVFVNKGDPQVLGSNEFLIDHHHAHALSAEFLSPYPSQVSFVVDGLGDCKTWSVFKNETRVDCGTLTNGSIGWGMREMGKLLGITAEHRNDIAGKLMSLQSYGDVDKEFADKISAYTLKDANKIFDLSLWVEHVGDRTLARCSLLNWAATVNHAMHSILFNHFNLYASPDDVITYSGGVAQNVVWNTTLKKHFKNLTVIPHSCDEGLSIGGLQWAANRFGFNIKLKDFPYSQCDIEPNTDPSEDIIDQTVIALEHGKTVGWYQGHGEVGPRALGNRSILMDPRLKNGKNIINRVKNRENYRPFGASVLQEFKNSCFDMGWDDPYMLYTANVKELVFPAITHTDGTCRIQTVDGSNPLFRRLLKKFYLATGCPVLLNTSLNVAGRPIAGSPQDAVELFNNSCLDVLVVGNVIYKKEPQ